MKKHTKKYYLARIARAKEALVRWESMYRRLKKIADYRYDNGIVDTPEYYEKANSLWERCQKGMYLAQERLDDCERDYDRRNWTASDYYMAHLIANNID